LAGNLNYFSMQQNFAPLTTLELNAAAYSNEINADVSILYLQAVVQSATMTLQQKLAAIQAQTQSLQTDIANQTATINTALTTLATLNGESLQDQQALNQYAADVQAINAEQLIQAQGDLQNAALANKTSLFGTIAKIAVGIAGLIPALAPVTTIVNAVSGIEAAATGSAAPNITAPVSGLAPAVAAATAPCSSSSQLNIANNFLPDGVVKTPYNWTMTAAGGAAPYSWTATGLPPGLILSAGGALSGTPTTASDYFPTFTVQDNSTPQKTATNNVLSLNIDPSSSAQSSAIRDGHSAVNAGPFLGISSFTGSVQIQATAPIVSQSFNFEAPPVFSSLPMGALPPGTPLALQ
jgi:hypothetical protein